MLRVGADSEHQLAQLTGLIQARILPHLSLADVQSLGQACRATSAALANLSDATLWQLAQV